MLPGFKMLQDLSERYSLKNNCIMRRINLLNAKLNRTRNSKLKQILRTEILNMLEKYFLGFKCDKCIEPNY